MFGYLEKPVCRSALLRLRSKADFAIPRSSTSSLVIFKRAASSPETPSISTRTSRSTSSSTAQSRSSLRRDRNRSARMPTTTRMTTATNSSTTSSRAEPCRASSPSSRSSRRTSSFATRRRATSRLTEALTTARGTTTSLTLSSTTSQRALPSLPKIVSQPRQPLLVVGPQLAAFTIAPLALAPSARPPPPATVEVEATSPTPRLRLSPDHLLTPLVALLSIPSTRRPARLDSQGSTLPARVLVGPAVHRGRGSPASRGKVSKRRAPLRGRRPIRLWLSSRLRRSGGSPRSSPTLLRESCSFLFQTKRN